MPIRGRFGAHADEPGFAAELLHLFDAQCGLQRVAKESPLIRCAVGGMQGNEGVELCRRRGAPQILDKESSARLRDACDLPKNRQRLGNVVNQAVRDDGVERTLGETGVFCVAREDLNALGKTPFRNMLPCPSSM
jgi:hypothetical protein